MTVVVKDKEGEVIYDDRKDKELPDGFELDDSGRIIHKQVQAGKASKKGGK